MRALVFNPHYLSQEKMNIAAYIQRINFRGELNPSLEVLRELQERHLLTLPFENLDIHYGNPIALDLDKIYQKLVINKRGGFCYELNGLFHVLLNKIGFDCKIISARVYDHDMAKLGREYDHLVNVVKIYHVEYLVDVGFGEFTLHPLELTLNKVQTDPRGDFIIENHEDNYLKVSKIKGETKTLEYIFTNIERNYNDFSEMCLYHQTHPASHFTGKRLISRPTKNGRVTLTGNTLKITENGAVTTNRQFPEEEYGQQLLQWFNIDELKIVAK